MFGDVISVSGFPNLRVLELVQHVYVIARGELVGVALRLRMGLSVITEWIEWDSDRGSDGSWFSSPYGRVIVEIWSSDASWVILGC